MDIIEAELSELRKCVETQLEDTKLVTCVPSLIRLEHSQTAFKRVAMCFTYPSDYPNHHILIELKSKNISMKLLDGLVQVAEAEAKKYQGKPHVLQIMKFLHQFFLENPLSCCSEEIANVKKLLNATADKMKLSQKTSSLSLTIHSGKYFLKTKVTVPHEYPLIQVRIESDSSNFPRVFKVWFVEYARELSRRCVEPPIKPKPNEPPFEARPSLEVAIGFLVKHVKRYPDEICQFCRQTAFPEDPEKAIHAEHAAAHVERVYCSHVYHHDCLILYMKTPPFTGGKKCHACGKRIYHEKWKVTPELAEARWAHEQAKQRELGEVVEFFGELATTTTNS